MNCPMDYDEISECKESEDQMMIHENKSIVSSLECVEQSTKMLPRILRPKERQKIQNTGNIQDTNDVVVKEDTRGIINEDALLLTKK